MTESERTFLAQMALGWFSMQPDGTILRHIEFHGGGTPSMTWVTPRPAACSTSAEDGYPRILFFDGRERQQVAAHRIVWMLSNRSDIPDAMEINHIDGNKQNPHPSNLELVTRSANVKHAIRMIGRKKKAQDGSANPAARLTEAKVMEIRALWAAKALPQSRLAERFGVKQSTISAIVRRKSWAHLA